MSNVNAHPTKNFFVSMLTRDISLEDAILDLLDNCLDGVVRTRSEESNSDLINPYEGFWAKIEFSSSHFRISDNCGGIPREKAEKYAFRMGRPDQQALEEDRIPTVGVYGIGMKRAIFKMGREASVRSLHQGEGFRVEIAEDWMTNDDNWDLPIVQDDVSFKSDGTEIHISNLTKNVAAQFDTAQSTFEEEFYQRVSELYAYILKKGFSVEINGRRVSPQPLTVLSADNAHDKGVIAPFLYEAYFDEVSVEVSVGFLSRLKTNKLQQFEDGEIESDDELVEGTTEAAGITVICNDRAVVYKDTTNLTGWGSRVPKYHPQFRNISGVVVFRSDKAELLPLTTTKHGIDASSELYLYVRDFLIEGLKVFTKYTNQWKPYKGQDAEFFNDSKPKDALEIAKAIPDDKWTKVRNSGGSERRFIPNLPKPEKLDKTRWIRFERTATDIDRVADHLFEDTDRKPSEVGEKCFEIILKEAEE